ncbi:MAG TPA: hypothetical protein V6D26_03420 [Stenomitos sp.]
MKLDPNTGSTYCNSYGAPTDLSSTGAPQASQPSLNSLANTSILEPPKTSPKGLYLLVERPH